MASLQDKLIKLKAKEFNLLRKKLLKNPICNLLLKNGRTNTFTVSFNVINWYEKYDSWGEKLKIQVADNTPGFKTALMQASDFSVDEHVYVIDKRDIVPPTGPRPFWEFAGTKTGETVAVV